MTSFSFFLDTTAKKNTTPMDISQRTRKEKNLETRKEKNAEKMAEDVTKDPIPVDMVEEGTKNHIPEDMVIDIFLKLPVKSIIRFSCASKFWNSLITSPIFIKNHLSKSKQRKQLFLLRTSNPIVSYSLHLDNDNLDRYSQLEFPIQNRANLFEMYGSSNGIVCLSSRYLLINSSKRIILWNPSIRKTLDLPAPRSWAANESTLLGIGYDPRSDDYKVARFLRLQYPADYTFAFQYFSLNLGYWNENAGVSNALAANEDTLRRLTDCGFEVDNQVIVNGVIHWLLNCRHVIHLSLRYKDINSIFALSFNLSNGSFGEIMMPGCFDLTKRATEMSISAFNNSLSFSIFDRNDICEVWVMQQYSIRESWAMLYRIGMDYVARPVAFRSNEEILMAGYAISRLVSRVPQPLLMIRDMGLEVLIDDHAAYFVESLALLDK